MRLNENRHLYPFYCVSFILELSVMISLRYRQIPSCLFRTCFHKINFIFSSYGRRGLTVDRKPSSKSSGSDQSVGSGSRSGSRKSSSYDNAGLPNVSGHAGLPNHAVKRLSASRHSLASKGSDVWIIFAKVLEP